MSIIQSLGAIASFGRIRQTEASEGLKPYLQPESTAELDLRRARRRLLSLYRSLEAFAETAGAGRRFRLDLPDARSSSSLGLDLSTTAASLQSAEEINTAPMSFTPFGPEWNDGSTAAITIGGVYDGSNGSGTLTFEVRRDGVRNVDNLRIRVEDPGGRRIRNVNIRTNHALDRQYNLQNGLYLTLGAGALVDRDTTTIQVFDNVGAAVDPDKPLGGVRNSNPNLEFGGPAVVNGGFTINGESIAVSTNDTINDVIARINQSAASVTASFANDALSIVQDQTGSVPTIDFAGDTSNFLAVTKLSTASVVPGIDPDNQKTLATVAQFATIQAGSFRINGRDIAIDPSSDSLDTVIDRINASEASVQATFDPDSLTVSIEASDARDTLTLDGNGTGLFAALRLPEGRVDSENRARGISRQRSYQIADATDAAFTELNALFRDATFKSGSNGNYAFRSPLESALRTALGGLPTDVFGLNLDESSAARRRGDFVSIDRSAYTSSLQRRGDEVGSLLTDSETGLIDRLMVATVQSLRIVNSRLGIAGSVVDTFA